MHPASKLSVIFVVTAALIFQAACSSPSRQSGGGPVKDLTPDTPLKIDLATAATISGKVVFKGKPPVMRLIDMSANPNCDRRHPAGVRAEMVVVNPNGTLRNTFVWIKAGLPTGGWAGTATERPHLDQDGCVYRPHVLALLVGQELEITNSDDVNHNVHAESSVNQAWNESQPPRAEKKHKTFAAEEIMFPITCSVHPWMRSYLSVVSHPFFAVTGDDGTFSLKGVPPGSYTLEAVHEKFGRQEIKVTLAQKQTATADFTFGE